jgi:DNA-binding CsgD family transcriptional regulator/tetratricopeptide (TPR) repeat protein
MGLTGPGSEFVGRAAELALLAGRSAAARLGEGGVALICGEPGIGKTRLATEAAARAAAGGMPCVRARAVPDEGSPPYWLFRQVLRELTKTYLPNEFHRAHLSVIAPELRARPRRPDSPANNAEQRFAVFESVREYLTAAAAGMSGVSGISGSGLVLLFDDVHWADPPSLRLLRHLAEGVAASRLVLFITYRDTETGGREELTAFLAALARQDTVTRIRLTGLSQDEVARQLAAVTGGEVAPELAAAIGRRARGNPFFVSELARVTSAAQAGAGLPMADPGSLPDAVRDTVRVRLNDLSSACRDVLIAAAVLGSAVDPAAVAAVTGREPVAVLAALDEAAAAGILAGGSFGHDLIREVARLELPTAGRLAVHARMAGYLQGRPDAAPALVAYHLLESLPAGPAEEALLWAQRAAETAMDQLAWEDAAALYARALRVPVRLEPARRCRLLLGLALARLRGFDLSGGSDTLRSAAAAAREAGDPALTGEVALAMEGYTDPGWVTLGKQLCDEALAGLPEGDSPLRARLLARRAAEATYHWEPEADPLSEQALAMAERLGDPQALRSALRARQVARGGPGGALDRVSLGSRMLELGLADGDDEAILWGRMWRVDAFAQLGRVASASAELLSVVPTVMRLRSPGPLWHLRRSELALAYGRGEFDQAFRLLSECLRLAAHGHENMRSMTAAVTVRLNAITGRDEWLPSSMADFGWSPPFGLAMRALWHLTLGRPGEARECYQRDEAFVSVPGIRYLITYATFAELCEAFADAEVASVVYEALLPYADLFVCGGAGLTMLDGSVHRYLGLAALTLGRTGDAVRHLREAVSVNEREGLATCAALATFDLARALAGAGAVGAVGAVGAAGASGPVGAFGAAGASGRPGTPERAGTPGRRGWSGAAPEAAALAASAAAVAERLGMLPLLRSARSLSAALDSPAPGALTRREAEIASLIARGLTNRQVAAALHISERTAENHVQHILTKLALHTRTQIATWAVSEGL